MMSVPVRTPQFRREDLVPEKTMDQQDETIAGVDIKLLKVVKEFVESDDLDLMLKNIKASMSQKDYEAFKKNVDSLIEFFAALKDGNVTADVP
jgi:vacuolar-type H+-ATPase subunit D/Vma8